MSGTPDVKTLLNGRHRILVTGGAGFIGGAVVRRLLQQSDALVFNLDKCGYASDLTSIEGVLGNLGPRSLTDSGESRHQLLRVDLSDMDSTTAAVRQANPDLVMHLAAESHVDRSIEHPEAFLSSNVTGTYNLLEALRKHWQEMPQERQAGFRLHHISTDEVFGSLGGEGRFSEATPYNPRSPYSASKAASDHLVNAWYHTYGLPVVITNCSNNYGPWQFPEKLIPVVILKASAGDQIPLYGDGKNIRDWLYVEDHVDALIIAATKGKIGRSYCVGGDNEQTNKKVVHLICNILDELTPKEFPHSSLITSVTDRPGHDQRYAIDPSRINKELGWNPRYSFDEGIRLTVSWYLANSKWLKAIKSRTGYAGERLGLGI